MPLKHSPSDKARSENIAQEIRHGKSKEQAAAIAYDIQRKSEHKGSKKMEKKEHKPKVKLSEKYEGHNKEEPAKMSKHEAAKKSAAKREAGVKWNEGEYSAECSQKHEAENKPSAKFSAEESPMGRKDEDFKVKHSNPSKQVDRIGKMGSPMAHAVHQHGHHEGKHELKHLSKHMPKLGKVK